MTAPSASIRFELVTLGRTLRIVVLSLVYGGLCAEIWQDVLQLDDPYDLVDFFGLSYEANLPTWVASCLHFSSALAIGFIALSTTQSGGRYRAHWWVLAFAFAYISLDEFTQLHENLNFFDFEGMLHFSWIIPAGFIVAVFGLAYIPFLAHLPASTRNRFMVAGAIFVGGALGIELPLGWWTDRAGDQNFVYAAIDLLEEGMELTGVSLFLYALIAHLLGSERRGAVVVASQRPGADRPPKTPAHCPGRAPRRVRVGVLICVWLVAALGGAGIIATGTTEYQRYEDKRGNGLEREHYMGEDLSSELRGGSRFMHAGTRTRFDRNPEFRGLALFLIGGIALVFSARGLEKSAPRTTE